jgi:hypothetical protein
VLIRHARTSALLLGAALVLTASPAAASPEQPASSTAESRAAQPSPSPSQQQATTKQLFVNPNPFRLGPFRPGDEVAFAVFVGNGSGRTEEFVLTFTLPPELTLISLGSGDLASLDCSGNVCRGSIGGRAGDPDNARTVSVKVRISSSFRGDTSTVRADLQEDANADPRFRTTLNILSVLPPAAQQPTAAAPSSGTGASQTLPRTGDRTTTTALLALSMLGLGAAAQAAGRRRPTAIID